MKHPNRDQLAGKLHQIKGNVRQKWGKLTDSEVDTIAGRYEQLTGMLQERYGKSRGEIEKEIDEWVKSHQ